MPVEELVEVVEKGEVLAGEVVVYSQFVDVEAIKNLLLYVLVNVGELVIFVAIAVWVLNIITSAIGSFNSKDVYFK